MNYPAFVTRMQRIADLRHAGAVLQWDQETYLPAKGAHFRGQQISTLSEISHQMFTEESLGELMKDLLAANLPDRQKRNVELAFEDYEKSKKYSSAFVRRLSEQSNITFHAWIEARKKNDFSIYRESLGEMIKLKREETSILGYEGHPYNALLNDYEKGCTTTLFDKTFADLLPKLKDLMSRIGRSAQVDDSFLRQTYPASVQWEWGMHLLKQMGFDFEGGRQDLSEHPFSTSFNPNDVRITTRVDESDLANMTWSCIHELGHAFYEQGLPLEEYGLPLGEACSYSIHESQSRLWENNVGRSQEFCEHFLPQLKTYFPEQLKGIDSKSFYRAINKVQPSLVRTEADEISYHFHVYIRYALEKKLIEGSMETADIPEFWNNQYRELLGVTVPDDKQGCLQDVHWSHGSFGYFPTYSLGSFYAAQFYAKADKDLHLKKDIANGNFAPLLKWLRENIHSQGRYFTSEDLCRHVTGQGLEVSYFVDYLLEKYGSIYTL